MKNLDKNKVVVGMSGGVDSSVVAALLVEQGYEVIGLTITPFKVTDECKIKLNNRSCCDYQSVIDAMDICDQLGMKHYFLDLSEDFKENIIDNFVSEYLAGRTPNPCVICNPKIKWGMLNKADELGAYYLATGHYAGIYYNDNTSRYTIQKGLDKSKDQSYFLWRLSSEQLSRTLFPIGNIEKSETRLLAEKFNLKVSKKLDSQEICFVPNNDYSHFIRKTVPDIDTTIGEGNLVLNGMVIGKHKGYPFYTIGQRKGLGVSYHEPLYVRNIIAETNTVEVVIDNELSNNALIADDFNISKYEKLNPNSEFTVKIRYRDNGSPARCFINEGGLLEIHFNEAKRAITPGQSVVIYEANDLVGGAVIKESFNI